MEGRPRFEPSVVLFPPPFCSKSTRMEPTPTSHVGVWWRKLRSFNPTLEHHNSGRNKLNVRWIPDYKPSILPISWLDRVNPRVYWEWYKDMGWSEPNWCLEGTFIKNHLLRHEPMWQAHSYRKWRRRDNQILGCIPLENFDLAVETFIQARWAPLTIYSKL